MNPNNFFDLFLMQFLLCLTLFLNIFTNIKLLVSFLEFILTRTAAWFDDLTEVGSYDLLVQVPYSWDLERVSYCSGFLVEFSLFLVQLRLQVLNFFSWFSLISYNYIHHCTKKFGCMQRENSLAPLFISTHTLLVLCAWKPL